MEKQTVRILHIEDTAAEAILIHKLLEGTRLVKIDVTWVRSLTDGLKRLAEDKFDVVLTDLQLPDSYGMGTFRLVQDHALHLPIVLLTNIDEPQMSLNAIQSGAQDYLLKSRIDTSMMEDRLRFAIERHHISSELRQGYEKRIRELSQKNG